MYFFPVIDEGDAIYHLRAGLWIISEDTVEAFGTCFNMPFVSLLVIGGLVPKIVAQAQC